MRAKTVTVVSQAKYFGLEEGKSTGSEVHITYEVDEDTSMDSLKKEVLRRKWDLDQLLLIQEYARGTLSPSKYASEREVLRDRYNKLFAEDSE